MNNGLGLAAPDPEEGDKLRKEEREAFLAAERKRKLIYYHKVERERRLRRQRESGLRK